MWKTAKTWHRVNTRPRRKFRSPALQPWRTHRPHCRQSCFDAGVTPTGLSAFTSGSTGARWMKRAGARKFRLVSSMPQCCRTRPYGHQGISDRQRFADLGVARRPGIVALDILAARLSTRPLQFPKLRDFLTPDGESGGNLALQDIDVGADNDDPSSSLPNGISVSDQQGLSSGHAIVLRTRLAKVNRTWRATLSWCLWRAHGRRRLAAAETTNFSAERYG